MAKQKWLLAYAICWLFLLFKDGNVEILQDEGGARQETKQKVTFKIFKNGNFWKQGVSPDRKSFITQSKHIFWSNEMFFKAYDLFLFLGEKLDLILGGDYAGPAFAYSTVLLPSFTLKCVLLCKTWKKHVDNVIFAFSHGA